MILLWKIGYLDSEEKELNEREVLLDTERLDATTRAAVEFCAESSNGTGRLGMIGFRGLFVDTQELRVQWEKCGEFKSLVIDGYYEDEDGRQLTSRQIATLLTGSPRAVLLPLGAKQHYVDYVLADKRPIDLAAAKLAPNEVEVLTYFARDFQELLSTAFYQEGPGTLSYDEERRSSIQTAVNEEELRSFMMVFRRLYMKNEPAGFVQAAGLYCRTLSGYAVADYVGGELAEYEELLRACPDHVPGFISTNKSVLKNKVLMDVYLNTRFAHQPNSRRVRQYRDCLAAANSDKALLVWLALSAFWKAALRMGCTGRLIGDFIVRYCDVHGCQSVILDSVVKEQPGIGTLEKRQARVDRLMLERVRELARSLWVERGSPAGGPDVFLAEAEAGLKSVLNPGCQGCRGEGPAE